MPNDALCMSKMNVGLGRKQPWMHDSIIPLDNPFGLSRWIQSFNYPPCLPEDHPHKKFEGQPKGMCVIAQEHGYAVDLDGGKRMIRDCMQYISCNACKVKSNQSESKEVNSKESESKDENGHADTCCLWCLLSMQEDFRRQKCLIQSVHSASHSSLFLYIIILFITYGQAIEEGSNGSDIFHLLPKFYPKLNPLKYLWGWLKHCFWEHSNRKLTFAKSLVPTSLNACPLVTIRHFFCHSECYINIYSLGATELAAKYAVKKYKSH